MIGLEGLKTEDPVWFGLSPPFPELFPRLHELLNSLGRGYALALHSALLPRLSVELLDGRFTQPCQVLLERFQFQIRQWALWLCHRSASLSCSPYVRL